MSKAFNEIINDSIIVMYNLNFNDYNKNNEVILAKIAKEKIGKYFNDNYLIHNGNADLTDFKQIFEYDPAL